VVLYLVDSSSLITAHNTYLALHRVPEFWDWLRHNGANGIVKLPKVIYEEVEDGNDELADWMGEQDSKDALLLDEAFDPAHVQTAMACYGGNLTEADLVTIGKDPFLVATALVDTVERCVVTAEVSKPGRTGPRRHLPNVCADCGVTSMTLVQILSALNFSTRWRG
jgi:hypothetical protein